jgi:hypothetical protein
MAQKFTQFLVEQSVPADYDEAKKMRDAITAELSGHEAEYKKFPKLPHGLTPDEVRKTQDYKDVRMKVERSFRKLQNFNTAFVKLHKKSIQKDRYTSRK